MAEDGLDFTSSSFNPLKALYTAGVQPPVPNVQIFNNINEYAQSLKLGKAAPKRGSQTTNVKNSDGGLAQRLKNIADNKTRSRNRDPSRLAHLMKVKSKTDGIEEKVAMLEKAKKRPQQKNVLQRMEDNYKEGPLSILYNCIEKKQQLRVWTRRLRGLRGICVGYLIAFDKHMNLAMMDVDEMFAIEEEVEIDPVIAAQRIERKKEKKRNWRRRKRKLLKNLYVEQNKEDEMIESTGIAGEIPEGENHGNGDEEVQPTFCSDDHVFEFSLRITNVDGSRNITRTGGLDTECLQSQNSPCVLNLKNNKKDEVNVKDGKSSMTEDKRLNAGEVCTNKDPIEPESMTFEELHFSGKEGNVKDERELKGLYVGSEDQADKGKMKEEVKEEMKEDNSNTLDPMPQRLNDSTCWPSRDEEGTGSDRESRNGSYSSDEEGKLTIWEEGQCGSEDEATTDDIQMKGLQYDLNEKHSLACSGDEEDIWGGSQCSGEGRSDNQMKITKGIGVKEEKNIMEGDDEGMLRILNSDEATPDMENEEEVIENSSKGEDQKGTRRNEEGKWDSSYVHSEEEMKRYNVQKKEAFESILKEEQTITRSDEEGRLRKWDGSHGESEGDLEAYDAEKNEEVNEDILEDQNDTRSDEEGIRSDEESTRRDEEGGLTKWDDSHGDSKDEMVTGEVEKKQVIEESLKDEVEKDTRSDEEGTRSDEEGRLRNWEGSHGDSEEEMETFDVEKKEVIEDSLKEDQKDTRSDEEGTRRNEEGRLRKWEGSHGDSEGEMVTGEVEKKGVIEESLKEEDSLKEEVEKGTRSDEEGTRSDEEGRLRNWDGSHGDSEDELETCNVEKKEGIEESLKEDQKDTRSDEEGTRRNEEGRLRKWEGSHGDSEGEMVTGEVEKKEVIEESLEEDQKITRSDEGSELTAKDIVKPKTSQTGNEKKEEGELSDIVKPKTSGIGNKEKEELTAKDIVKPRTSEIGNEEKEELTAKDIVKPRTSETRNEEKEEGELTSSDEEVRVGSCEEGGIISSGEEKEVKNVNRVVRPHQKRSAEKDSQNTKKGTKNKELKERSKSDSRKRENTGSDSKHERSKRFDKATNEVKHGRQQLTSRERNRSEIEDKRKRSVHERTEEKRRQDRPSRRAKVDRVGSGNQERLTKEIKVLSIKRERSSDHNSGQTSQKDYKAKKSSETGKRLGISTEWTSKSRKTSTEKTTGEKSTSKPSSSSVRQDKPSIKKGSDLTKKGGGTERTSKTKIDKVKKRDGGIYERKKQGDGDIEKKGDSDGGKGRKVESAVNRLSTTTDLMTSKRKNPSKNAPEDQSTRDSASSSSKQDQLNDKNKHEMRKSGTANENKEKLAEKVKTAKVVKNEKDSLQQNVSYGKKEDGERQKSTKMETLGKESGKHLGALTDNTSRTHKASRYATTEEKRIVKYSSLSSTTKEDKSTPSRRSSFKESSRTASDGKAITAVKKSQNYFEEGKKITPTEKKPTSSKEDKSYCGEVRKVESLQKKPPSSKKDRVDSGKGRKIDSLEKTPASRNDCREGRRVEPLEKKASFSEKDSDCRKIKAVEMNPSSSSSSSKNEQTDCGKGAEIKALKPKPSKKDGDCGEAKDTKTVKENEKTSKNKKGRTTAASKRYTETSKVKKSTDNKKDINEKKAERDKKKNENEKNELNKDENSKGNKGVKKIDKRRSLKRKQREDECTKNLGNQRKDVDTTERPSKVRKVEEGFEKRQSRIKTKEAKLPGKVVSVRVLKVVRGKALVLKKRHVNQLFIRGDNVIMVAYENVNSVGDKL